MTDNTSTIEIIGSKMKAESLGTQSDDGSTSLLPGHKVRHGTVAKKIMAGPAVTADAGSWQTRPVSSQALPTTPGMKSRQHSGETVPSATNHPVTKK